MATDKTLNYTAEQETEISSMYLKGVPVAEIAQHMDKSERSVVAKLSRIGVYQSKAKASNGAARVTKAQLVQQAECALNLAQGTLETFEKADKAALQALVDSLRTLSCQNHNTYTSCEAPAHCM